MKRAVTIGSVLSMVLVFSALVYGQKASERGAATKQAAVPLKVTFYAVDDSGNYMRMYGHTNAAVPENVTYVDGSGLVVAYLTGGQPSDQLVGEVWFRLEATATSHIDLDFVEPIDPGPGGTPPLFEGSQRTFRMSSIGLGGPNFVTMPAGVSEVPLVVQFFVGTDEGAWTVGYDRQFPTSYAGTVDVDVQKDSAGNNVRWTLTPRAPVNVPVYAGADLDKFDRPSRRASGTRTDYGTWVMPFKVVLERK